jgi:DNA-binding beta-propeller fold protein YncE
MQIYKKKKRKIAKKRNKLYATIYPSYQDVVSDIQTKIHQLKEKYGDLTTAIAKHGEDWHEEIDTLVQKLKDEVEEMKTTHLYTLQKQLDEVNEKISAINDEIHSMDVALDSNDMSKVFSFISNVDEHKKLPQKMLPSLPKFTPGRIQELSKMFGTLSISVQSEKHGYNLKTTQESSEDASSLDIKDQLLDEPQTVTTIHTRYKNNLYHVACLSDEEIWTCGYSDTMKLFSTDQGSLLNSITTESGNSPQDIAVTNTGDLVYTDYEDKTVNIVKNEEIQNVITLQNWRPRGVCSTFADDLLVILESIHVKHSKVVRYSGSKKTQTIQFDNEGHSIYSFHHHFKYKYISENRNFDICVADNGAQAVVVVNHAGKLRFRYTGHAPAPLNKPFGPLGIATDSQSNILTADYHNNCVHIIDQDGEFLCYIDCGLSTPYGLCIDTNDNLFVAQCRNKQVKKIEYKGY